MADKATFRIWRGGNGTGHFVDYATEISPGMVVLDSIIGFQACEFNDMAVR
jgi:succinate dehydrogenase / fumarate reductase iron-sulfur subunit